MARVASRYDADNDQQQVQQILDDCALELAYEKSLQLTEILYEEERARQLRVQILLLEDENDSLHDRLALDDDCIDELTRLGEDLQSQLDTARNNLEKTHSDLRLKSREIETLKVELSSLHEVTMDSTKLLTEKLALARELSSLKPEIDHLRSQTASHQAVLAEKLSLQRQVSAMQVELEMEKRATQRAVMKEGKLQVEDARITAQMESLQAELAKERKERLKAEREAQKLSADWDARQTAFGSRLETLKTQLKATKDQLKATQNELRSAQALPRPGASRSNLNIALNETVKEPRKRIAARMDDDTIIGTPGDSRASKKSKRGSTMPGDKSTFSITPFLNRTASVGPESFVQRSESSEADDHDDTGGRAPTTYNDRRGSITTTTDPCDQTKRGKPMQTVQDAAFPEKPVTKKANAKVSTMRRSKKAPALEQVAEEEHNANVAPGAMQLNCAAANDNEPPENSTGAAEIKKKKRKLLGGGLAKTLFDEDDGEAVKGDKAGARPFGTLGRIALGGSKANQRLGSVGDGSSFGSFSPLKKDRMARS